MYYYPSGYSLEYQHSLGAAAIPPEDFPPDENGLVLVENGPEEIELDEEPEQEEITTERWMFSSTVAQQIFSVVPGLAGGLAGFILALKLANTRRVNASEILLASGIVAAVTFSVIFLIRTVEE